MPATNHIFPSPRLFHARMATVLTALFFAIALLAGAAGPAAAQSGGGSCASRCNSSGSDGSCWCDESCRQWGDCCDDYWDQCPVPCGGPHGESCDFDGYGDTYCEYDEDTCHDTEAPGTCRRTPQSCSAHFDPVCGCDGQEYPNDCERRRAGVSRRPCDTAPPPATGCERHEWNEHVGAGRQATAIVSCPSGYYATGGGVSADRWGVESYDYPEHDDRQWRCHFRNGSNHTTEVGCYARCCTAVGAVTQH